MRAGHPPTNRSTRPNGGSDRVRRFFKDNPHEELSIADLGLKFGLTERQVRHLLNYMLGTKELKIERVVRWNAEAKGG